MRYFLGALTAFVVPVLAAQSVVIVPAPKPEVAGSAAKTPLLAAREVAQGIAEHMDLFDRDVKMAECEKNEMSVVRYDLKRLDGSDSGQWWANYHQLVRDWNALVVLDNRLDKEYAL